MTATGCRAGVPRPPRGGLAGDWTRHQTTRPGAAYRPWAGPRRAERIAVRYQASSFPGLNSALSCCWMLGGTGS